MVNEQRPNTNATMQNLPQTEPVVAATEETPVADADQQSAVVLHIEQQQQQQQQSEAPENAIPLNAKWTMWFDHPRLAPAGSE
jgi:hypothetical protein